MIVIVEYFDNIWRFLAPLNTLDGWRFLQSLVVVVIEKGNDFVLFLALGSRFPIVPDDFFCMCSFCFLLVLPLLLDE